jgi:aminopeptidase N
MICAHEVAHLWFGCLVGPRWWDDVWLDEAIATYLSCAALAAIAGVSESLSWTGFAYTDKPEAYKADERAAQPAAGVVSGKYGQPGPGQAVRHPLHERRQRHPFTRRADR